MFYKFSLYFFYFNSRFEEQMEESLPFLEDLVLSNNNVQELIDLDPLATIKSLRSVCLLRNPVANKQNYRSYVIYKIPQLRIIDFKRIKDKERSIAKKLFSGKRGEILQKDIAAKRSKTFEVKDIQPTKEDVAFLAQKYKDQEAIKVAIANASTLEEVRKLELLLQQGHVPGKSKDSKDDDDTEETEMEMS